MNATFDDCTGEVRPRKAAPQGVTTVLELQSLDEKLMIEGYLAGLVNLGDTAQTDLAYLHGYLNGLVDGGHSTISSAQELLARDYVQSGALGCDVRRWQASGTAARSASKKIDSKTLTPFN